MSRFKCPYDIFLGSKLKIDSCLEVLNESRVLIFEDDIQEDWRIGTVSVFIRMVSKKGKKVENHEGDSISDGDGFMLRDSNGTDIIPFEQSPLGDLFRFHEKASEFESLRMT